jgi:hypothetical protein
MGDAFHPGCRGLHPAESFCLAHGNGGVGYPDDGQADCLVNSAAGPRHPGPAFRHAAGAPIIPASGPSDLSKLTAEPRIIQEAELGKAIEISEAGGLHHH